MNKNMLYSKQKNEFDYLGDNTKGKFFLKNFRLAKKSNIFFASIIFRTYYKIIFNYLLGIDIDVDATIGFAFNVYHGQGLVISKDTIIGDYVTVRQNTTIGNASPTSKSPTIGNNVNIGANCVVIGDIKIGDNVIVAAGSVVIRDVPSNVMIAGNPAVIKRHLS